MKNKPLALDILRLNSSIRKLKVKVRKADSTYLGDDFLLCQNMLDSAKNEADSQDDAFRELFPYIEQASEDLESLAPHIHFKPTFMDWLRRLFLA